MKLIISAILFCFCLTVSAQYSTGPDRITLKADSSFARVYDDGLMLYFKYRKQIANKLNNRKIIRSFKFDSHGDSILYTKTKFIYLIDGEIYKKGKRESKLKTLNPDKIVSFDVYTKNEAYEIFGIKAKYGLIKIEFLDD